MGKWILKSLAALIVIAPVVAVIVLLSIDRDEYQRLLVDQVRAATGRDMVIDGIFDLRISLRPALVAEQVRLANADWGSRPDLARIQRLEAQIALVPLLWGEARIHRLVLIEPDILLERRGDGRGNWVPSAPLQSTGPGQTTPIAIAEILILDGRITWRREGAADLLLIVDEMHGRADGEAQPLDVTLLGRYGERALSINGQFGSLLSEDPLPLSLKGEMGGVRLAVDGAIVDPFGRAAPDMRIRLEADEIGDLAALMGTSLSPSGPVYLSARLFAVEDVLRLADIDVRYGDSDLKGEISIDSAGARARLDGSLSSEQIVVEDLWPFLAGEPSTDGRLFDDEPLPFALLDRARGEIELRVARLRYRELNFEALSATVALDEGGLRVRPFTARLNDAEIRGTLGIDTAAPAPAIEVELTAAGLDIGGILRDAGLGGGIEGRVDLAANLRGEGRSLRQQMARLDGAVAVDMGKGKLTGQYVDLLADDLLRRLLPWAESVEDTEINCLVARSRTKNGVATIDSLLLDTTRITARGTGTIDFVSEQIDLLIKPDAKAASLVSLAVPIKVQGGLVNPSIIPDPGATLGKVAGTVLGVAILGPLGVLAPFLSAGNGGKDACAEFFSSARDMEGAATPQTDIRSLLNDLDAKRSEQ